MIALIIGGIIVAIAFVILSFMFLYCAFALNRRYLIKCEYCASTFMWDIDNLEARCPHCGKENFIDF